jgi:RHS repeat-associated protein
VNGLSLKKWTKKLRNRADTSRINPSENGGRKAFKKINEHPFGMMMPARRYEIGNSYRYGFNGKESDPETYGDGNIYDYGFRIYNPRIGRFLSVDPLTRKYPELTPYQFASNMPIIAIDLDGKEADVKVKYSTITKDRTQIEVVADVNIKIQVLNISNTPNSDLDLSNVTQNLTTDLYNRLNGSFTSTVLFPFNVEAKDNHITKLTAKAQKDWQNVSLTYKTNVNVSVEVIDNVSKINKDGWVFALVDDAVDLPKQEVAGYADLAGGGKVGIGEVEYFQGNKAFSSGRHIILHEVLHLLGAEDTYTEGSHLPGTTNNDNVMYGYGKGLLTQGQMVQEIWYSTIGPPGYLLTPGTYVQPKNETGKKISTQEELKKFVHAYAHAGQLPDN